MLIECQLHHLTIFLNDQVRTIKSVKKVNEIINRLHKTKEESTPDLAALLEARNDEERKEKKKVVQAKRQAELEAKEAMKKQVKLFILSFGIQWIFTLSVFFFSDRVEALHQCDGVREHEVEQGQL